MSLAFSLLSLCMQDAFSSITSLSWQNHNNLYDTDLFGGSFALPLTGLSRLAQLYSKSIAHREGLARYLLSSLVDSEHKSLTRLGPLHRRTPMLAAYLTTDEVNLHLAEEMAAVCGITLCPLLPRHG